MDIEWAKDGVTGELFIVQARPETVMSRQSLHAPPVRRLLETSRVLARGRSVGSGIATGVARVVRRPDEPFAQGDILVTEMTDPDWLPLMRRASAVVTDHGGRTCHAAILSRELGIPAVVGTSGATTALADGSAVTVSCAQGDEGLVYDGRLLYEELPATDAKPSHTRPSEIAAALLWLASPAAGAVNGQRIPLVGRG